MELRAHGPLQVWIVETPNPDFTGERYGVAFTRGRALVDDAATARRLITDFGYHDATPAPAPPELD